ncbi:MAG TPA: ABC transporter permease [Candidatus Saccharimonadales bacterium]|nr:ABC transporter permease [Candidatus Saccharimonadales bacterium]
MHNLGTVIRFETTRTLKKKSFWIAALSFPIIAVFIGLIVFFSNKTTDEQAASLAKEKYSIGITDESGIIPKQLASQVSAKVYTDKQLGVDAVKSGQLDAYFFYPKDITKSSVEVYGKEVGLFENGKYQSAATQILEQSALAGVKPEQVAVLQNKVQYQTTTYTKDGSVDPGFMKVIAPGLFLVLFYFMIATFGNQMLTSVIEEKENRVIEMILATIKPTTLLLGKLISLIGLALIQMVIMLIPTIVGYLLLHDQLKLPNLDLSAIPFNPVTITIGALVFFVSFLMYAGLLIAIGAAMPTAKEAGSFFGVTMMFLFGPLYAVTLFVSAPQSPIVQILSYFPLTAPIPLMLRNAVGNLSIMEAAIAIAILLLTTIVVTAIGVRIFRFGALEYSRRLSIKEVIGRKA